MKAHHELRDDGETQGRDPRQMSADDLTALGLERGSRGGAIRAKCLDCVGDSPAEVRRCADIKCPLWPYRMGTDPWRAPISEERKAESAARMMRTREKLKGAAKPALWD